MFGSFILIIEELIKFYVALVFVNFYSFSCSSICPSKL